MSHPNLVQMYDLAKTADGVHYIVMQYIEGVNLSVKMNAAEQESGQFGLEGMMHLGWQIADLFSQLHQKGLIHRDLKPGNIMVVKDPTIHGGERYMLLDFGIAKLTDADKAKELNVDIQTTTGQIVGTIPLMSPESFTDKARLGPQVDVYALGCILYRCIAGNYPFGGKSSFDVITRHMHDAPIPLTAEDPQVPPDVADLVHRMLAKVPADRPTMAEIAAFFAGKLGLSTPATGQIVVRGGTQQLQALLVDLATTPPLPTISDVLPEQSSNPQSAKLGQQVTALQTRAMRRRRRLALGGGLGVAALLVMGVVVARNVNKPTHHPAAVVPVQPAPPVAVSPSSAPDLGSAVATPIHKPASMPSASSDEKPHSPEKKRKKKKNGLLVHD